MITELEQLNLRNKQDPKYKIFKEAIQVVPGAGNPKSPIMFIGEAPGATEDKLGTPFVGAAGKFLNVMLESIGMKREDIYITNMVKCRPPENRDPLPDEIALFKPWVDEEIRLINPKVFVPLGRHALHKFLPDLAISKAHGQLFNWEGKVVFAMYHPAVALYNGGMRKTLIEDFQNLKTYLETGVGVKDYVVAEPTPRQTPKTTTPKESKTVMEVKKIMEESRKKKESLSQNNSDQIGLF